MPSNSDNFSDRQHQILDATLELVAMHGLLNTSISKISKKAQCSPGIIYHHFESKDEIMETLYLQILTEMTKTMWDGIDLEQPVLERYKAIWLNKYHYHRNNPYKTIFMEQFKNSAYFTATQEQTFEQSNATLTQMGHADIVQGRVVDLPHLTIYTMTLGVALNLAKDDISMGIKRDPDMLHIIAERVCRSVLT